MTNVLSWAWIVLTLLGLATALPLAHKSIVYLRRLRSAEVNGPTKLEARGNRRRELMRLAVLFTSLVIGGVAVTGPNPMVTVVGLMVIQTVTVAGTVLDFRERRRLVEELVELGLLDQALVEPSIYESILFRFLFRSKRKEERKQDNDTANG